MPIYGNDFIRKMILKIKIKRKQRYGLWTQEQFITYDDEKNICLSLFCLEDLK